MNCIEFCQADTPSCCRYITRGLYRVLDFVCDTVILDIANKLPLNVIVDYHVFWDFVAWTNLEKNIKFALVPDCLPTRWVKRI